MPQVSADTYVAMPPDVARTLAGAGQARPAVRRRRCRGGGRRGGRPGSGRRGRAHGWARGASAFAVVASAVAGGVVVPSLSSASSRGLVAEWNDSQSSPREHAESETRAKRLTVRQRARLESMRVSFGRRVVAVRTRADAHRHGARPPRAQPERGATRRQKAELIRKSGILSRGARGLEPTASGRNPSKTQGSQELRLGSRWDPARVESGRFAADMKVQLINDGPVTVPLRIAPPP